MTTDWADKSAPPGSPQVYNWVQHFYGHFNHNGLGRFGDAVTKAIYDCDDPVSSACGATVYYSNCKTGRHTSIRCASCGAGCRINYCEEQFSEFQRYLDARKRNLNTDGPDYSISRTFEGHMRDFAEFLQLKSRTGFEITDDIEASCY